MFKNFFALIIAYVGIATYAFTGKTSASETDKKVRTIITGRISPADGLNVVWVISGKDSLKTPTADGSFSLEVKPGIHQLVVDAKSPYKDVIMDNLNLTEKEVLDLGEITLKQ